MPQTPLPIMYKIQAAKQKDEKKLDLSECGLTFIPEEIYECHELEELWLQKNAIKIIPGGVIRLKKLKYLVLNDNPLESITNCPGLMLDYSDYVKFRDFLSKENIAGLRLRRDDLSQAFF